MTEKPERSPLENRIIFVLVGVTILAVVSLGLWFWLRPKPIVGTIRLGVVPAAYYLPLMVAVDQHLFEKYGYKGDLDISNNNNEMINKLLRGEVQVSGVGSGGTCR